MEIEPTTDNPNETEPNNIHTDNSISSLKLKIYLIIDFVFMGIINHLGVFLILTGSRNLSHAFNKPSFMGFYTIATFICASLTRILNKHYLKKITHKQRITCLSFYLFFAYALLFTSLFLNKDEKEGKHTNTYFAISLIACFMMGTGYAFGENTMLDYMQTYPKFIENGWIFGTGISSVIAVALNVLARYNKNKGKAVDLKFVYLMISPLILCYIVFFINAMISKEEFDNVQTVHPGLEQFVNEQRPIAPDSTMKDNEESENVVQKETPNEETVQENNDNNTVNQVQIEKNMKRFIYRIVANYIGISFLEFTILNGLVERVMTRGIVISERLIFEFFEMLILFYFIGNFISRCLFCFLETYIKPVEIFIIIQVIYLIFWILEYYFIITHVFWKLSIILLILGFIVGGSYRTYNHAMLNNLQPTSKLFQEKATNIRTISKDVGILCSGIMVLILDNFIIKLY